jgi:SynChlorMet cassette radical SAM/SPASM protein ScmE
MNNLKVMSVPRHVDIAITGKCNLTCKYCFYADEMVARSDLPTGRWLSFFDELGRLRVMSVCLTGGEIFTRPDLFELIDRIIANSLRYSLISNGTMITEETIKQFEIGKRRLRLDSIQISMDGSSAEVHNLSRPKSFGRALHGLRLLKETGLPLTVRVTINRYNVDDLENVAYLLLEDVGLSSFSTNEAYACGITARNEDGVLLTREQRLKVMDILTRLNEKYDGRITANAGPLALVRQLDSIQTAIAVGKKNLPGCGMLGACGGVWSQMAVLHDGTMVPCHNMSTFHLGMIGIDDFQNAWLEQPIMENLRSRPQIPLSNFEICCDCDYQGYCVGGCPGQTYFSTGNISAYDPTSCIRDLLGL